jgi:hypothetical protein
MSAIFVSVREVKYASMLKRHRYFSGYLIGFLIFIHNGILFTSNKLYLII